MKINVQRIAVTGGVIWGALMFLTTLLGVYFHYGLAFLTVIASIYPGYTISLGGNISGALYGFVDVFIGVYIFSWVYHSLGK